MARIIWVAGMVLLLAVTGCSDESKAPTGEGRSEAAPSSASEAARDAGADSGQGAEGATPAGKEAASEPSNVDDATDIELTAPLNAKPDDPAAVEPPADSEPTAPEVSSEVSSEVNRWMAGMLGDAAQRLEAIERLDEMGDAAIAAATCLMRTGDAESRRGAAAYLGIRISSRDAEAIAELCSALNDADSQVRQVALQAIDRLPKSQLVQALAGLIALAERADEDETFRVLALRKLGSLGADGRRASEALERLGREDDSSKVRIAAFSTLAKVAKPEFAEKFYVERLAECEARDERRLAAKWLGRVTTSAAGLHGLVAAFADSDKEVRMAATHALVDIGKPAVQALAQGLESPEAQVRQYSAFTLGKLGRLGAGAIDQLRRATEDEDERVRRVAEAALRLVEGG